MPERLRLSRRRGWKLPEGARSVARPSRFGNPFLVGTTALVEPGRHGSIDYPGWGEYALTSQLAAALPPLTVVLDRRLAVALFAAEWRVRMDIAEQDPEAAEDWLADLTELRGWDLACWCPLDGYPCHADVLLELANAHDPWWLPTG